MSKTHIAFVLDESGSMASVFKQTVDGFNEYLQELKKEDTDQCNVTLVKFSGVVETAYTEKPVELANELNKMNYRPGGGTALYDAIASATSLITPFVEKEDAAIVVVLTDGYENSSRENTHENILELIKNREAEGNWTFAYLGADQDAWATSQQMGFAKGNTMAYASANTVQTYSKLSDTTNTLRRGKAQGVMSSVSFLAEDKEEGG